MSRTTVHLFKRSIVLIAGTLLLNWLIIELLPAIGHAYPFWPASGVAVALVIADGVGLLPAVWLASFLLNLFLHPATPSLAFVLALGVTLQTTVAASLGRRISGSIPKLRRPKEIISFLLATGPLSCLVGSSVSAIAIKAYQVLIPEQLLSAVFTGWAGNVMGVVVMTPITLMLLPEMSAAWEGRRCKIAIPSILLALLTQIAFSQAITIDQQKALSSIKTTAAETSQALTNNLERYSEIIDSLRRFELSSEYISSQEFHSFTSEVLERYPGLHGLSWNPIVTQEERDSFEQQRRQETNSKDFQITERNKSGSLIRARQRQRYIPVSLIEPKEPNQAALGYDILSNHSRAMAVRAAERTNSLQATSPIELVQEQGSQQGVLILDPTRTDDGTLQGFAVGVLRMGDMLRSTFSRDLPTTNFIQWRLTTGDNQPLATYGRADNIAEDWIVSTSIPYAGAVWQLALEPSEQAIQSRLSHHPQQLLLIFALTAMISQAFLLVVTARDQEESTQAKLSRIQAIHDPLTDLLNRRGFHAALDEAIEESRQNQSHNCLLYLDLDHFKPINDHEGHQAGDAVLIQICNTLTETIRKNDIAGRIGGDEFAIILKDCPAANAQRIGEKLLREIRDLPITFHGNNYRVTASMGLLSLNASDLAHGTIDDIMHRADVACYQAKHSGRDQMVIDI